jgi:hypothetical protein
MMREGEGWKIAVIADIARDRVIGAFNPKPIQGQTAEVYAKLG